MSRPPCRPASSCSNSVQRFPNRAFHVGLFFSLLAQGPPGKDALNGHPGLPGPKVGVSLGTQNTEAKEIFDCWLPGPWITFGFRVMPGSEMFRFPRSDMGEPLIPT